MAVTSIDGPEFRGTYFALRLGLIFAALLVLSAPISAWVFGAGLPPTISDSWYTDARAPFVMGLAAGSCLLIVVRGDTLTEHTLLNVAGWLGLFVAGVACKPDGDFDPAVLMQSRYAIGCLLTVSAIVLIVRLLPWVSPLFMGGWSAQGWLRLVCRFALPVLGAVLLLTYLIAPDFTARNLHFPAAAGMFALLGIVALARTTWGVHSLQRMGDAPVDDSLGATRVGSPAPSVAHRFDRLYTTFAALMFFGPAVLVLLALALPTWGPWLLIGEVFLLLVFGAFWGVQTREGWLQFTSTATPPAS